MNRITSIFRPFIAVLILQFIFLNNNIFAQMPPHERVRSMIKNGTIPTPYVLQHLSELRSKGIDMPWREMLEKQNGIHLEKKSIGTLKKTDKFKTIESVTSYRALMILVKFSDKNSSVNASSFDQIAFGTSGNTLRTYYNAVSRTTFDIVTVNLPSSTGWIQMPQTYSYYVNGQNGTGDPTYPYSYPHNAQKLAEDAVAAVDGFVDFSQYDNDGDGYVDALMIVHAGPGAEFTASSNDIWSHSWHMNSPKLHDGVYTYTYTIEPEYWQNPGDITCGVFAHEFGHMAFDLPDLYDTDDNSEGLGNWSLMAGGSWNGPNGSGGIPLGGSPAFPDAWCRIKMGYANVLNINSYISAQQIPSVQASTNVYCLWKYGTSGQEYFLAENRQQSGFDTYLPGNGLIIYHVDDNVSGNNNQWYPGHTSSGHYQVAIEQSDNSFDLERKQNRGDGGDTYPGSSNNRSFSSSSSPNSNDYSGNNTYVSILNISNSSSTMTADFNVGSSSVVVDEKLQDNATRVGTIGRWNGNSFPNPRLTPGQSITAVQGTAEILQGDQAIYSGQKYNIWKQHNTNEPDVLNHHIFSISQNTSGIFLAQFQPTYNATVSAQLLEGGNPVALDFQDPWLIDYTDGYGMRNQGMSAPFNSVTYSQNNLGTSTTYKGVFLGQDPSQGATNYYSVRAPITKTINGNIGYFQNWSSSGATFQQIGSNPIGYDQKAVIFNSSGANIFANYKGHLCTGAPSLTNTKNQRRIIWGTDQGRKAWVSVYESMGDIWMTMYDEIGDVIVPETRLNTTKGVASNPTISNTINFGSNDYDRAIIGWLENINGAIELHLQAIKFEMNLGDYWGWTLNSPHTGGDRSTSHAILNAVFNSDAPFAFPITDNPISTARPVLSLMKNGNGLLVTYAYESSTSGKYLVAGQFQTSAANQDLYNAALLDEKIVSTDATAKLPAIAAIDASHIFVYFTTGGYSTLKLSEFNYSTAAVSNLTLPSGDVVINSIQAATNNIMCTRAVVADVLNYSVGAYSGLTVDYFYSGIPMMGYTPPVLRTKYNSFNQPSVMSVDLSHATSYFTPVNITLNISPLSGYFTQYRQQLNGTTFNTTFGSSIAGTFLREKASSGSDSVITLVNNSTSPARFIRYPSTGGGLQKESADKQQTLITATKSVRLWHDKDGNWHTVNFNFDTLQVDILRDQENSHTLCAVKFPRVPKSGSLISQPDSLKAPVTLVLERQGKTINSFSPASWTKLSANNLPGIQDGDIVRFNLPGNNADSVWGYEEISYVRMKGLSKDNSSEISEDIPVPTEYGLDQNYPNPFNPTTMIEYQLPKDGFVSLKIYDILGREVRTLVNEYKSQGRYSVSFDASKLASGVYIYQLKSNNYSSIKKMILAK
jgi:M6 family metalloprotease-like protein